MLAVVADDRYSGKIASQPNWQPPNFRFFALYGP
jgi:hypothetical protein